MRRILKHILIGGSLLFAGCDQRAQSILDPRSDEAGTISDLWWVMFILGSLVFVAVMFFTLVAVLGKSGSRPPGGSMRFVWAGGIVLPAIILVGLLIYSLKASFALSPSDEAITIEPRRICGIVLKVPRPEEVGKWSECHWRSRVTGVRRLHRVHRQCTDRIDAELIQLVLTRHRVPVLS